MLRKILFFLFITFVFLFIIWPVKARENSIVVHFFWASGCPHCLKEKTFFQSLKQKYPQIEIKDYEITKDTENLELLKKVGKELSANVSGVPFTVVGNRYVSGYYNDKTTGIEIEKAVKYAIANGYEDVIKKVDGEAQKPRRINKLPIEELKLPILGFVNIKNISLPVLTFFIALLDGFNPCAMWTLLFLISLLLGLKDKKRMWMLGIAFIVSSAFVYFLFLSAWLNLFLFLGFIIWVRIAIGLVALGSGFYYLRDYFINKKSVCKVAGNEKRQKVFEKIRDIIKRKQFFMALGGIIVLAFAVNLVELICSAGLPAIYTQILSLANLPRWQHYLYLVFYIFIFMLDDLVIFFATMITLQTIGSQSKYLRHVHFVGAVIMFIIGILLIFKPEYLMFG